MIDLAEYVANIFLVFLPLGGNKDGFEAHENTYVNRS